VGWGGVRQGKACKLSGNFLGARRKAAAEGNKANGTVGGERAGGGGTI